VVEDLVEREHGCVDDRGSFYWFNCDGDSHRVRWMGTRRGGDERASVDQVSPTSGEHNFY
jgi:hypothetical protein